MRYTPVLIVALAGHLWAAPPQSAERISEDLPRLLDEIETRPVAAGWGSIRGRVTFTGSVPQRKPNPRNPQRPIVDESLIVNEKNRGLADVIVWLYKPGEIPIHESYDARENAVVTISHANRRFDPHVNLVRVGQTLQLVNRGRAAINPLVTFIKNESVNPLLPVGGRANVVLAKAEPIPVKLSGSIHSWLSAIVLVQNHPYMAKTNEDGDFEIKNVPFGDRTFRFWHDRMGYVQDVKVNGEPRNLVKGRMQLNVSKPVLDVGKIEIAKLRS